MELSKNVDQIWLNKTDIYNVYALEYLIGSLRGGCDKEDISYACAIIETISKKLVKAALNAVQSELKHAVTGGEEEYDPLSLIHNEEYYQENIKVLKKNKLDPKKMSSLRERRRITFSIAKKLFRNLEWDMEYGGERWRDIAKAAHSLEKLLPIDNLEKLKKSFLAIDHLIDLEHNNELFLNDFCRFCLDDVLDDKFEADFKDILRKTSNDVCSMVRKYRGVIAL